MNTLVLPVSPRDHIRGLITAPISLVQYGDYQCPHCAKVHSIIQVLQQQLSGQLRYIYRHFPCHVLHPDAQHAAEAAEAAGNQGKFWEMHDCLYVNHHALSNGHLVEYAIALNLDINQFLQEVTGDWYVKHIEEDLESGRASGVTMTPAFFINGYRYEGGLDQESFLEALAKVAQEQ